MSLTETKYSIDLIAIKADIIAMKLPIAEKKESLKQMQSTLESLNELRRRVKDTKVHSKVE